VSNLTRLKQYGLRVETKPELEAPSRWVGDVKRVCTCLELSNKVNEVRFINKEIDLDYKLST